MSSFSKVLNRELITDKRTCALIGIASFSIATALSAYAKVYLPFTPVPVTLQTFFVLLSGAVLGRKSGSISQAVYIVFGLFGLPVFAGGTYGLSYLFGPTGGYLFGFVLASYFIGSVLKGSPKNLAFIAFSMAIGASIYFISGMAWLSVFMKISLLKAFYLGVLPFIFGDILKVAAASLLYYKFQNRISQIF